MEANRPENNVLEINTTNVIEPQYQDQIYRDNDPNDATDQIYRNNDQTDATDQIYRDSNPTDEKIYIGINEDNRENYPQEKIYHDSQTPQLNLNGANNETNIEATTLTTSNYESTFDENTPMTQEIITQEYDVIRIFNSTKETPIIKETVTSANHNLTFLQKTNRRIGKIDQIMNKLWLTKPECNNQELNQAIRPILDSKQMTTDLITKIFLPTRINNILCKTTTALRTKGILEAKQELTQGLVNVIKTISMNNNRLSIIRIMLGIASTRAIIYYPMNHYEIRIFTNIINLKLPEPMTKNREIKEQLTVLLAIKHLFIKLRQGHWKYAIKIQRRMFKGIDKQINHVLEATEINEDTDNISIEDEKAMEDEISAAFSNLNIDDMNINDLSAMLQEFNF